MVDETFLFDDFFVPADDPGMDYSLTVGNRAVPIRVARALTLGDREAAKAVATKTAINPQTGALSVSGFDEGAFNIEVLYRAIKSWPFTFANGSPVPVTRQNIVQMRTQAADAFATLLNNIMGNSEAKAEALADFEKASGEASSPGAAADQSSPLTPSASA